MGSSAQAAYAQGILVKSLAISLVLTRKRSKAPFC